jgi:hypothetical protein
MGSSRITWSRIESGLLAVMIAACGGETSPSSAGSNLSGVDGGGGNLSSADGGGGAPSSGGTGGIAQASPEAAPKQDATVNITNPCGDAGECAAVDGGVALTVSTAECLARPVISCAEHPNTWDYHTLADACAPRPVAASKCCKGIGISLDANGCAVSLALFATGSSTPIPIRNQNDADYVACVVQHLIKERWPCGGSGAGVDCACGI